MEEANRKLRRFCFTLNNPERSDIKWPASVRYAVWQKEVGKEGTPHLQGYVEFKMPVTFKRVKKILPKAHVEQCQGSFLQNKAYCTKEESRVEGPWEIGTPGTDGQGRRSDIANACDLIAKGASKRKVIEEYASTYVKYYKGLDEMRSFLYPRIDKSAYSWEDFNYPPLNLIDNVPFLYGPSGTGKTEFALTHGSNPILIRELDQLREFNADVHDLLVFDDVDWSHVPAELRIHLCDLNRNSSIRCRYVNVVIPSKFRRIFTHNSDSFFFVSQEQIGALERRCEKIHIEHAIFKTSSSIPSCTETLPLSPFSAWANLSLGEISEERGEMYGQDESNI